jgi:integrase
MHYDDEQVTQMLLALEDEPIKYCTVLYIALDTGLRLSEIAGLTWPMINFDENIIHVTSQRQYVPGHGILQLKPKTASGVRIITMSETVANKLKDYRLYQSTMRHAVGSAWRGKDEQFVFTHEDGEPIHPARPSAWFNGFLKRKELPHITFHGLRHTNASLLISANVDIVTLAGRLGHSDKNVTLNTYSHIIRSREKAMANKMDQFYRKEASTQMHVNVAEEA